MEPIFEKVITGLPEDEAYELESRMIDKIGTIAAGTGPLLNSTHKRSGRGKRKSIDVMFEFIAKSHKSGTGTNRSVGGTTSESR